MLWCFWKCGRRQMFTKNRRAFEQWWSHLVGRRWGTLERLHRNYCAVQKYDQILAIPPYLKMLSKNSNMNTIKKNKHLLLCTYTLLHFHVSFSLWVELDMQYFPLELDCHTHGFSSFLDSSCELMLWNSCTPARPQKPAETLQYYVSKISLRVKIHATRLLCTLPFCIYLGSCPGGRISSRTPVCLPKQAASDSAMPVNPELSKNSSYRHIFTTKTHSTHTQSFYLIFQLILD